jgi:hypothetical protein
MSTGYKNKRIDIRFDKKGMIYTARAGLVPVMKMITETKMSKRLNTACSGMWGESRSDNFGFESTGLLLLGTLAGFPRAYQIVQSSEVNFFAQLLNIESVPSQPALSRFISSFGENNVDKLRELVFDVGAKFSTNVSGGFRIIVQDQSAIQKYGAKMEGVEKGYGGTLKRGSKMLQASLVIDGCSSAILDGEIRKGSTHSADDAAEQLDRVLSKSGTNQEKPSLVLGDSAYGFGAYIRTCEKYDSSFILAIKNDAWLKKELAAENFKRFKKGEADEGYGYREFVASRKAWAPDEPGYDPLLDGLRVIVVRLPVDKEEAPRFQFLVTNLRSEWTPEEAHQLYKQHRESIEIMNDELKNQIGLNQLPSQCLDGNRGMAQIIFLAWNVQRMIERVGMEKERDRENAKRIQRESQQAITEKRMAFKEKVQQLKGRLQRFEWWTIFVRFISVGGKFTTAGRQRAVVVSENSAFREWTDSLMNYKWKSMALT